MSQTSNPNVLYDKLSKSDHEEKFWGKVPRSFKDAVQMVQNEERPHKRLEDTDQLISILRKYHKEMGIYNPQVEHHLELLAEGSILTGQQPVVMGGPGLIANKIACLLVLSDMLEENDNHLAPVFFVGDYDGLQKELARQYYPNPISHNAFIIDSEEHLPEDSDIAAHAAPAPPVSWLDEYLGKLEENLRGFRSQVKGDKKKLLDERWDHIKTILKASLYNSDSLSDWAVRIWGTLTNVINAYGVIYLPTSHPEIRKLVAKNYLPFIHQAPTYTKRFQQAMEDLKSEGYEPSLPHRHSDYAPFTLECTEDQNRMTTTISQSGDRYYAEGKCPDCSKTYRHDVTDEASIMQIATQIGPRVDTSQAIFQDLVNIRIRISGPGEIAYYAQAAPAVRAIGFDLPVFVKYKRAFYNATWIEKLGKQLANRNQGSLHQSQLFEILKKRVKGMKEESTEEIQNAEQQMFDFISEQYKQLLNGKDSIDPQKYLGWQFGRFTPQKFGQEVSWVWFDMALQTGLTDYIDTYKRMYLPESSVGGYFYINSLL